MGSDDPGAAVDAAPPSGWRHGFGSLAALLVALLLIALVVLVARSNQARDADLARERQSYDVLIVTGALDAAMARSEAALGRFVISGDRSTGVLYYDEWRRAGRILARLRQLTAHDPEQARLVAALGALYAVRGKELAEPAQRARFRQGWPALSLFNKAGEKPSIARIAALVERIADNERATLAERANRSARSADRSNRLAGWLSAAGLLLVLGAILLGWLVIAALAQRRAAARAARLEAERVEALEVAVAERTRELSQANAHLRAEAATRAAAEAQLRQIQKMEAVGQLTGGIAHDFNNMLAVVVGGLDLARRRLAHAPGEVGRHLDNAMDGANRAAALTRRLLAFARAEPLLPEAVDPGALIAGMSELLDRTLGERVRIETRLAAEGWQVWCDPHQLESAILNLAVNARDALGGDGEVSIATAGVTLRGGEIGEAPAGDYVRISVADDGCGMTPEVIERVFEPFFTTKPVGKGTGLGLSQVFGFVRQSGGEVAIRSSPGAGATVSLYLPRCEHAAEADRAPDEVAPFPSRGGDVAGTTILVVEDDTRVRVATAGALAELGYLPLAAASGEEALALLAAHPQISLIVTDVVMPEMTGPELIARAAPLYPSIGVLFVTGYVGEAGDAAQFAGHDVLRKPFTVATLESAVRAALAKLSARRPSPRAAAAE